jgi:hypothetical protein
VGFHHVPFHSSKTSQNKTKQMLFYRGLELLRLSNNLPPPNFFKFASKNLNGTPESGTYEHPANHPIGEGRVSMTLWSSYLPCAERVESVIPEFGSYCALPLPTPFQDARSWGGMPALCGCL